MSSLPLGDRAADAITLFVLDPGRSRTFYQAVFGTEPIHEDVDSVAFGLANIVINLLSADAAVELVSPAQVGDQGRGPRFEITIGVEDLEPVLGNLQKIGVELINGPIDRPWGLRTASFADPDGYVWEIAAAIR